MPATSPSPPAIAAPPGYDPSLRISANPPSGSGGRLRVLDGWRAISILAVLSAHMLPLGPVAWNVNGYLAALGMTIFFSLSGFLIVSILLRDGDVRRFLIRRVARIVPLAWLVLAIVFLVDPARPGVIAANLLFCANLPPFRFHDDGHFWSLCVEMQFYAAISCAVAAFGRRALYAVPAAALAVTGLRIATGTTVSIVTWLRVDEILAGGMLALALHHYGRERIRRAARRLPFAVPACLFPLTVLDPRSWARRARAYVCAAMIGLTLVRDMPRLDRALSGRAFAYLARISYALYLIHPYMREGWLLQGSGIVRAAKRVLGVALSFLGAHLSTYVFERPINAWAHRVTGRPSRPIEP